VWPGYEPIFLARELGYFHDSEIRLVEYGSASQVMRAFRNGAIDGAALTLDEALLLAHDGQQPRVVAVLDLSAGGDVVVARPEIEALRELRGRRIGVESTALGAYMLVRALQSGELARADVEIVPIEASRHIAAYDQGDVDALVTFEPMRSKLLERGARALFDSTEIPGEIIDVLVVREDFLERHPDRVTRLVSGWARAIEYAEAAPLKAARYMAPRENLTPEVFLQAMSGLEIPSLEENQRMLSGEGEDIRQNALRLRDIMLAEGLLRTAVDPIPLFDSRTVDAAAGRR
jgi:NitT/TauT family transport system substrate-binding protein